MNVSTIGDYSLTVKTYRSIRVDSHLENIKKSAENIIPLASAFMKDMTVCTLFCLPNAYAVSKIIDTSVFAIETLFPIQIRDTEFFNSYHPKIVPVLFFVPILIAAGSLTFKPANNK